MTFQELVELYPTFNQDESFTYFQRPQHGFPYYFGTTGNLREFDNHDPRLNVEDFISNDWYIVNMTPEYLSHLRA